MLNVQSCYVENEHVQINFPYGMFIFSVMPAIYHWFYDVLRWCSQSGCDSAKLKNKSLGEEIFSLSLKMWYAFFPSW